MTDQGLFNELKSAPNDGEDEFKAKVKDEMKVTPFADCGQYYRGTLDSTEGGHTCDRF